MWGGNFRPLFTWFGRPVLLVVRPPSLQLPPPDESGAKEMPYMQVIQNFRPELLYSATLTRRRNPAGFSVRRACKCGVSRR
jgi:hypothetical protein